MKPLQWRTNINYHNLNGNLWIYGNILILPRILGKNFNRIYDGVE